MELAARHSAHTLFFHPLLWYAGREWQITQEMACDEHAIHITNADISDYGEALLRVVGQNRLRRSHRLSAIGAAGSPHTLKRRLLAMQFIRPVSRRSRLAALVTITIIGILGIIPWKVVAQNPGSARILFVSNRDGKKFNIFTMKPDGTDPVNLTRSDATEFDPVWSPDHSRIAFAVFNLEAKTSDIYVMKSDGTQRTQLTQPEAMSFSCGPAWSPDGKRFAYCTMSPPQGGPMKTTIYIMSPDGSNRKRFGAGFQPVWSPDGSRIAYTTFGDAAESEETPTLTVSDANGEHAAKLAKEGLAGTWTADRLYYTRSTHGEQTVLCSVKADGSEQKDLSRLADRLIGPTPSSDNKHIFCTRLAEADDPDGLAKMRIYVMDANGSNLRSLTEDSSVNMLASGAGIAFIIKNVERMPH